LADISAPFGMMMVTENGGLKISLGLDVSLKDAEPLEDAVANFVTQIINSKNITSVAGVKSLTFGSSPSDQIDTFSTVSASIHINPFVQPVITTTQNIMNDLLNGTSSRFGITPKDITVNWLSPTALKSSFVAKIDGLPGKISLKLPYLGLQAQFNGQSLVEPECHSINLENGIISSDFILNMVQNDAAANTLMKIMGDIVFHRPITDTTSTISITRMVFGSSEQSSFHFASRVTISVILKKYLDILFKYFDANRPLEFHDIQAQVMGDGIHGKIILKPFPLFLPLSANFGSVTGKLFHKMNGNESDISYTVVDGIFTNISIKSGQPVTCDFFLKPNTTEYGFTTPLNEAVPYLLEWQNFAQHSYVGGVQIWPGDPYVDTSFSIFQNTMLHAGNLTMFEPVTIKPHVKKLFTKAGIQFELEVYWPNPGPLHLDIGVIDVSIKDRGETLLSITNTEPFVFKNINEGANDNGGVNGFQGNRLTVTIPWTDFNPFKFFVRLIDLFHPLQHYKISALISRPGVGLLPWMNQGLEQVPGDAIANFLPIMVAILSKFDFKIFGITISAKLIPGFSHFLQKSSEKLNSLPPKHITILDHL
jgi:hypothetical protein